MIVERYERLRQMLAEANGRIEELNATVESQRREIAERDRQIEYLKVASVLTPDHRNVEATRALLSELVREIDKCINQLSL
ncbi:MAG: hypothetical protein K2G41_08705 [Duncaniella sp.]|uniref:hypothetical protein n=1 Tax=Duncaniella sp. TaxID=2518496 RepID=UPI0023CED285|nr:hypothetical protein [Duncaniella sp.]MDE6090767.1 hypothetical protein [Duncaniella sp.]